MNNTLRSAIDLRENVIMKNRIAFGNRLSAIERGADQAEDGEIRILERWNERFENMEAEINKDILDTAGNLQIVEQMIKVKGVGMMLAAKVVCMIDIEQSDTVSALWRYAGWGVVNGEREKPVKGEKLHYNRRLKSTLYLVGTSFLRSNSPYREIYDSAKEYYVANRPDWTKLHRHRAAMRKMIKVYLSHLWEVWRKMDGLPTRELWVIEHAGHQHYIPPEKFGW